MSNLPEAKENNINYLKQLSEAEREEYLITNNLRLVIYLARKFTYSDEEELVAVGSMGLVKAAHTFDLEKGMQFATYATPCIRNEILMFLRREKKHYRDVSMDEVVATGSNGSELRLRDTLVFKETAATKIETEADIQEVSELVGLLDERSRRVICLRYGINCESLDQSQVGKILGLSQSYVSRLERATLKKMKTRLGRR